MKVYATVSFEVEVDDKFIDICDLVDYETAHNLAIELSDTVEQKLNIPPTTSWREYCNADPRLVYITDENGNDLVSYGCDQDDTKVIV